ncbi:MAG: hypothetical protein J5635_02015 [Paludibacteraceae bacterium]|nr:hypothetical protein [Paludibacteraceae bacterium]
MKRITSYIAACLLGMLSFGAMAQSEVGSTYFLHNAPYRHFLNPAFEPITEGYLYLPAISHISLNAGNNSLSLSDLVINQGGKTMWTLNPESKVNLLDAFRNNTLINADLNIALLGFGWRTSHGGYLHFNLNERIDAGVTMPKGLFQFALGGGMKDLTGENVFNLSALGAQASVYTELAAGYSRTSGEIWTWGFKVKALAGHVYAGATANDLKLYASPDEWTVQGAGSIRMAAPLKEYPESFNASTFQNGGYSFKDNFDLTNVMGYFNGWGGAVDAGFVVKPVKYVTLSLAFTDIGVIYWNKGHHYDFTLDGTFDGLGSFNYADYQDADGKFNGEQFGDTIKARMQNLYETALDSRQGGTGFWMPLTMKLNVGAEVNLLNDIFGIGAFSRTMYYNNRFFEEVTLGVAVRPASWFNFNVNYSFLNGKWSNIGAGLGLRLGPFIITVAADYVPLVYASYQGKSVIPYKTQGVNAELGLGIVWGWKQKKPSVATAAIEAKN